MSSGSTQRFQRFAIAGIVAAVQASERERAKLQAALEKVQTVLADALR